MATIVGADVSALAEVFGFTIRTMERLRITDEAQVDAALADDRFRPPDAADTLGGGSTAALRDRMARFSSASDHPDRRAAVVDLVASIDPDRLAVETTAATVRAIAGPGNVIDAVEIAATVPTIALLATLGWPTGVDEAGVSGGDELDAVGPLEDVMGLAAAIGRGAAATAATDAGVDRLLEAAGTIRLPADPAVSLLYQNVDATAALLLTTIHALATGAPRSPAVIRTIRVADEPVVLSGDLKIGAGVEVELDLTAGGREFGFGPHACPGRETAEVIVEAVVAVLTDNGWTSIEALELGPDGIPTRLDLRR